MASNDISKQPNSGLVPERASGSPELRKLIGQQFPEPTKEERIRRAMERPIPTLGKKLPLESIRYYASELQLEDESG